MITGIHMYGLLENVKINEKEILKAIAETGIHRIEPCINLADDECCLPFWTVEKFKEIYSFADRLGIETVSCHIATDDIVRDAHIMAELAEKYGIRQFVVKLPKELSETILQETAFSWRMAADMIAHTGAVLLMHNRKADAETMISGRTAYEYMADICLGKVGMQADTGWLAAGGIDPVDFLVRNRQRIGAVHFKDFADTVTAEGDVCIGSGSIDNQMILQFARAKGIPFFIDQDCYTDFRADMKKSFDFLMDAGQQREHSVSFLNIYDTVTRKVKVLKKFDGVIEAPNWLHSDNTLIYNRDGHIYRFYPETGESVLIESGIACHCNNDHVLSSDEKEIAVSSDYTTADGSGSRIFILPTEGGEARLVTKNAPSYLHGWSPDKKELAYCAFREHDGKNCVDIYTIPAEGGEEKRLTSEGFNDGPEYSPDGKHIWFISTRTGLMQVYRMNRDGSDIKQMTYEEQNNWFGHVSPDCRKVVNLSYRKGDLLPSEHLPNMRVELWMMNYDGSEREKIMEFFGGQGSLNVNSWSADSRYFAFVSYEIEK